MQSYEAQGPIIKGKQQSVRVYCENLQYNNDTLRSNFSGVTFPENPVIGQHCYRQDNNVEYIYTANGWEEVGGAQGEIAKELNGARGTHESLTARLDVALNPDGTLKAGAEVNLDEWKKLNVTDINFVDRQHFTVAGNYTSIFSANRAVKLEDGYSPRVTFVEKSYYNKVSDSTTITVRDNVVTEQLNGISVGVIQKSLPSNVAYKDDIKANQPETTGFKGHVASGLDLNISGKNGYVKVNKGRAYVSGSYEDLAEDTELDMKAIQEGKHLVYAHKKTDGGLEIKTKRFESPVLYNQIKNIPKDDLLFITDWSVEDDADARNLIKDKSGNACHLQPQGTVANIKTATPISWKVPSYPLQAQDIYWKSTAGAFQGLPAGKKWAIIHSFVPRLAYGANPIPFIVKMSGGVSQIDFRLFATDTNTETYTAGVEVVVAASDPANVAQTAATIQHSAAVQVRRNVPCLLALEYDGENFFYYINGRLAYKQAVNKQLAAATAGTIWVNQYDGGTFGVNTTNLFSCIRSGIWGQREICEICNQMGIPTEHMGYAMKTPELFHGVADGGFDNDFHAWMMNEAAGNVVYDVNTTAPLNGVTSNSTRVLSSAKNDGHTSVNTSAAGVIDFDRISVNGDFSAFAYITPRVSDGTIMSNSPTANSGFILSLAGKALKAQLGKTVLGGTEKVVIGEPVLVGMVIEGDMLKLYCDNTNPTIINITDKTGLADNNTLTMGYNGAKANLMKNTDYHAAVVAKRAFSDAEVRELFKSFKHQEYRYIADDNGISSEDAILGMVKVNEQAVTEQIETYPCWGRNHNPFGGNKYFIGWYTVTTPSAAKTFQRYYIPNLFGSGRVKVNFYARKNDGTDEIAQLSPNAVEMWSDTASMVTCLTETYVNKDYIAFSVGYPPVFQMGGTAPNPFLIGIEVEPLAENNDIDNLSF